MMSAARPPSKSRHPARHLPQRTKSEAIAMILAGKAAYLKITRRNWRRFNSDPEGWIEQQCHKRSGVVFIDAEVFDNTIAAQQFHWSWSLKEHGFVSALFNVEITRLPG